MGAAVFVLCAIAFRWARSRAGYWTIDDAGITYAAAYQLADHGSLAPYAEGTPVESYSNPLLVFVVAVLRLVGIFDPARTHLHLEMLVFGSMIVMLWSMLRAWTTELAAVFAASAFAALELVTPASWEWYGSGLENVWVSAGLIALLWICARTARGHTPSMPAGVLAFLVSITRPEAPVYVAGFYVALAFFARSDDRPVRAQLRLLVRPLAVTVALYLVFLCWRRVGYGDWWPNTFYAKVVGDSSVADHFRDYVLGQVARYGWSAAFALSVLALLFAARLEAIARCLVVLLLVSLALPVAAGADWMGEHRFATAFFVVSHVAYATFLAACIASVRRPVSRHVFTLVVALAPAALVAYERVAAPKEFALNDVTLGHIAHTQGGIRWLHQMRLGLPYPVVMVPDAGGSLLVGGMQFIDTASLADFQQARIMRDGAMDLLDQYQHEERRPDLVHFNPNVAAVDPRYLGTRYLQNESHLAVRRDLVELTFVDPAARLLFDLPDLKVYLSPDTVRRAAPTALVRCELIVAWNGAPPPETTRIKIIIGADHDEIELDPYQANAHSGIERRGLLVGAPREQGSFPVTIELSRDGHDALRATAFELAVTSDAHDLDRVAAELVRGASPHQAAKRVAWLREQLLPRFSARYYQVVLRALYRERFNGGDVGLNIDRLRHNARLAAFESLPTAIRTAETAASRAMLDQCPSRDDLARRTLCLGRTIDELRRLGYLQVLARLPAIARELEAARARYDQLSIASRYLVLVGLTLADPSDISLQRRLLETRRAVAKAGPFPSLQTER